MAWYLEIFHQLLDRFPVKGCLRPQMVVLLLNMSEQRKEFLWCSPYDRGMSDVGKGRLRGKSFCTEYG